MTRRDAEQHAPDLRRAAAVLDRLTPRTVAAHRRQVRVMNAVGSLRRALHRPAPPSSGVEELTRWHTRRAGGGRQRLLVLRPSTRPERPGAAVLWIHGGGFAVGTPEDSLRTARRLVEATGCVVVLPQYRLSVEAPYPAALHDCYDALLWLRDHAAALGAADDQLVVGGESAGGGLTAATALLARDRGEVAIAFQVPLYPMLDDRPTPSSTGSTAPVWNSATNESAWDLYLGPLRGAADVPATAAPARAVDLRGLPPVLTFVGGAEPFHDEDVAFVQRLEAAGVPVRSRVFPGCFHGFDLVAPSAGVSREATAFLVDGFRALSAEHRAEQPVQQPVQRPVQRPVSAPGPSGP